MWKTSRQINTISTRTRQDKTVHGKTRQDGPQATERQGPTCCLTDSSRAKKGLGGGEVLAVQTSQCTRRQKHKTVHDKTGQDTERHRPTCCLRLQQGVGLRVLGKTSRQINTRTRQDSQRQGKTRQHGPQATERQALTCCLTDSSRATEGVRNSVRKRPTLPAKCRSSSWRA